MSKSGCQNKGSGRPAFCVEPYQRVEADRVARTTKTVPVSVFWRYGGLGMVAVAVAEIVTAATGASSAAPAPLCAQTRSHSLQGAPARPSRRTERWMRAPTWVRGRSTSLFLRLREGRDSGDVVAGGLPTSAQARPHRRPFALRLVRIRSKGHRRDRAEGPSDGCERLREFVAAPRHFFSVEGVRDSGDAVARGLPPSAQARPHRRPFSLRRLRIRSKGHRCDRAGGPSPWSAAAGRALGCGAGGTAGVDVWEGGGATCQSSSAQLKSTPCDCNQSWALEKWPQPMKGVGPRVADSGEGWLACSTRCCDPAAAISAAFAWA